MSVTEKRKLDDHTTVNYSERLTTSSPPVNKMLKHDQEQKEKMSAVHFLNPSSSNAVAERSSGIASDADASELSGKIPEIQFFIKMIPHGKTIVMRGRRSDTVESVHERVFRDTGIPVIEQRLLYRGKQLYREQRLVECGIENDSGLQLVGRLRSTHYPVGWQVIGELVSVVMRLFKGELILSADNLIRGHLSMFLSTIPGECAEMTKEYVDIFVVASVPTALMMLYSSTREGFKKIGASCIEHFLNACIGVDKGLHYLCVPMVLEFFKLFDKGGLKDIDKGSVYKACRYTLGVLLQGVDLWKGVKGFDTEDEVNEMSAMFLYISELKYELVGDLMSSLDSTIESKTLAENFRDFIAFLLPVKKMINNQIGFRGSISSPLDIYPAFFVKEVTNLRCLYNDMMDKMNMCLFRMELTVEAKGKEEAIRTNSGCTLYLAIMKELHGIAKYFPGVEELFWNTMRLRRDAVRPLVLRANRNDDHFWLLGHNDVTDFESRRHLALMMLHEIRYDYNEVHEMLIDRSKLLEQSFAYIAHAEPETLRAGLFMEFKDEEATGPGVLREWFLLVCQALFNQQNALFVACEGEPRRFYPNPASSVDPLHLEYFTFSGRIIALALMHRVQVGVLFARCFFLQLSGKSVTWEDIQDADPLFCSSCKNILEMNENLIDDDALGLTFVDEVEELGSRKVVELCPGGRSIVVKSNNREQYINLLIQHKYVNSVSEQVAYFSKGFHDMICHNRFFGSFFGNLEPGDFDLMLYGNDDPISVEDWKGHTDYKGYEETDPQIVWFWKIVGEMPQEQKKVLLFFWTSMKHLPYNGFGGLTSRLQISRVVGSCHRLPTSQTCFNRLCVPTYPTMDVMRARLNVITQEHVGSSFGSS